MKVAIINCLLFGIMVVAILANWAASRDFTQRNWIVMFEMLKSVPYDAWSPNPNTADGQTLQRPVEGTVARGFLPMRFEATPEDAIRAGAELLNPKSDDAETIDRGQKIYTSFCNHCHGSSGAGDGMVAKRGFPPPPSLLAENAMQLQEGQMFHLITYGQGNMPGHASQITRDDRWNVISYIVHSIQKREQAHAAARSE